MKGWFITFEGIEGCGKSTHSRRLASRLEKAGYDVVLTREPGGTPLGEAIRRLVKHGEGFPEPIREAEMLLFAAARAQHVHEKIIPALRRGAVVICDRFMDSTTAYQGYGRGIAPDAIAAINTLAVGAAVPDATVFLDIPVPAGFRRLRKRNRCARRRSDRFERENRLFHERVRKGYLALARRFPRRIKIVNASGACTAVAERVWKAVRNVVGKQD